MKLLTVNLCMEAANLPERIEALGKLVRAKKPEFIALQGVNNETLGIIKASGWCVRYPHLTQPPTKYETRTKPTVAILSTYPVLKSTPVYYQDSTSNKLAIIGYYVMHDKQKVEHYICVCSTLLETGADNSHARESEINQLMYEMKDHDDCFVLGDLSLLKAVDGDLELSGGWQDAWLASGNSKGSGYTVDPGVNPLIKTGHRGRPDRVLFKSQRYGLDSAEVVGTEKYGATHVSPHFGVFAVFSPLDTILPDHSPTDLPCSFTRVYSNSH